jgi:hypothetical protein
VGFFNKPKGPPNREYKRCHPRGNWLDPGLRGVYLANYEEHFYLAGSGTFSGERPQKLYQCTQCGAPKRKNPCGYCGV